MTYATARAAAAHAEQRDADLLDWDAQIVTPPPRRRGTIQVRLAYRGRARPAKELAR